MAEQFTHESSAESSYLPIGLSFGIEVGPTLSTSHIQSGKCILEGLLEAKEFQDRQVNWRMESKTAFVWTESGIVLIYAFECVSFINSNFKR